MHVIASDIHRLHDALELSRGKLGTSTEAPRRVDIIANALRTQGHTFVRPDALDHALLNRVHTPQYIEFLATAWERWQAVYGSDTPAMAFTWPSRSVDVVRPNDLVGQLGYHSFSADSSIVAGTWTAAAEAAAMAQTAADRLIGSASAAYALCRPSGHHATADQFGGYCFINNSAIAAQRFLDNGHSRVAILDIDYHHGNGTQAIFYARSDAFTVSIHADPIEEFPWFSGHVSERGTGSGEGWNLNLPLARGTALAEWNSTLINALERIASTNAGALVVGLGVDTYINDPLGTFALDTSDYTFAAQRIHELNLPTAIVQEGCYAVDAIGDNVAAFLKPFN